MGGRLPVICAYDSNLSRLEDYIFRGNAAVGLRLYSQQEKTRKLTWLRESILSQWLFLGLKLRSKKVGFTYW